LGVKVIGLYSPIRVQSVFRWGPWSKDPKKSSAQVPQVVCGETFKCSLQKCPYYECMGKIPVADIVEQAQSMLDGEQKEIS